MTANSCRLTDTKLGCACETAKEAPQSGARQDGRMRKVVAMIEPLRYCLLSKSTVVDMVACVLCLLSAATYKSFGPSVPRRHADLLSLVLFSARGIIGGPWPAPSVEAR